MQRRDFLRTTLGIAAAAPAFGQGFYRRATSPPVTVNATVGGKPLKIEYYSPSMRGRKIYGSLVPYGEIWCPGANWSTAITSEQAGLEIGAMKLPKGSYALWVVPGEKEFELILNRNPKAFHLDHDPSQDIGKTKMALKALSEPVEELTFQIRDNGDGKGTIALIWEKTEATVPFSVIG
jgi:hypothetical protein